MDKKPGRDSYEYLSLHDRPEDYRLHTDRFLAEKAESDSHLDTLITGVKKAEAQVEATPDNDAHQAVLEAAKEGLALCIKRNGYATEYPIQDYPNIRP